MPDIRYVCLSDMHLGADNSVLTTIDLSNGVTTDPETISPVWSLLVGCLRALIKRNEGPQKPTLVLNGDILEMALTDTNKAARCLTVSSRWPSRPMGRPFLRRTSSICRATTITISTNKNCN